MGRATTILVFAVIGLAALPSAAQESEPPRVQRTTRVERAADGSVARGLLDVPDWLVIALGGSLVGGSAAALITMTVRRR